jgi:hypothetical protein
MDFLTFADLAFGVFHSDASMAWKSVYKKTHPNKKTFTKWWHLTDERRCILEKRHQGSRRRKSSILLIHVWLYQFIDC